MRFGEPIAVARISGAESEESARKDIEAALRALTWQVDEEARR